MALKIQGRFDAVGALLDSPGILVIRNTCSFASYRTLLLFCVLSPAELCIVHIIRETYTLTLMRRGEQ